LRKRKQDLAIEALKADAQGKRLQAQQELAKRGRWFGSSLSSPDADLER
jgi:hypothetical protein